MAPCISRSHRSRGSRSTLAQARRPAYRSPLRVKEGVTHRLVLFTRRAALSGLATAGAAFWATAFVLVVPAPCRPPLLPYGPTILDSKASRPAMFFSQASLSTPASDLPVCLTTSQRRLHNLIPLQKIRNNVADTSRHRQILMIAAVSGRVTYRDFAMRGFLGSAAWMNVCVSDITGNPSSECTAWEKNMLERGFDQDCWDVRESGVGGRGAVPTPKGTRSPERLHLPLGAQAREVPARRVHQTNRGLLLL